MTEQHPSLSAADYERFQTLILERTGMLFGPRREHAMARGIAACAQGASKDDLNAFFAHLKTAATDSPVWEELIAELTVGETYFFRDAAQIRVLQEHILPELLLRHARDQRIRVWSAGCASGEEPYTIAMLLSDMLPDLRDWSVSIQATDINKASIDKGRAGVFREWSFRQTDGSVRQRYFVRRRDDYAIAEDIKRLVSFNYLNLNEDDYPSLDTNTFAMDLILFRNVAIYHSEAVVRNVVRRFHRSLVPGGWLMVGSAETAIPVFDDFELRAFKGSSVYQKIGELPRMPSARPPSKIPSTERAAAVRPTRALDPIAGSPLPGGAAPKADPMPEVNATESHTAESEIDQLYRQGIALMKKKRYDEAIGDFQACLALDANYSPALCQTARCHANAGRISEARYFVEQTIAQSPMMPEAHYILAMISQEQGDTAQAISSLKKALYVDADFALAHFTLAMLYEKTGRFKQCKRHLQQSVQLLDGLPDEATLPGSDGLLAGQLKRMVRTRV